jgi:hydrogenase-4 component F
MILFYLIVAYLTSGLIFINRKRFWNYALVVFFAFLQWSFTIYSCYRYKSTDMGYFTADSIGILLLITLSIISIPAFYHGYLYIKMHNESAQSRSIYFAALLTLITSITAAYLANHIAVIWIFAELTTLSASALIYHHRNKLALEGTWKYVFICAISITFVLILGVFLNKIGDVFKDVDVDQLDKLKDY